MSLIVVSDKNWPVLRVTPPAASISDEDLDTFLLENLAYLRMRKQPFCYVIDLRNSGGVTPVQRKRMARAFEESQEALPGLCCGTALVFTSSVLRGMLTAILWLKKPRYETKVFTDIDEATDWGRAQCLTERRELKLGTRE